MGSVCLLVSSIDEVVIERNRNFSSARSGWNLRKTLVFSKSKCYFQAVRWPNIPCMLSQCYLDEWIWNVGCIQYLAGFSTSFRWKILWKKYSFQLVFCFIKSLALSVCLKVRHVNSIEEHFKQNVCWWFFFQFCTSSGLFWKIYWQ